MIVNAIFFKMRHIDTSEKQREFKCFLENSSRIIFSAKFGDGKTQFLKELVQNNEFKEYQFFTIYPVNYVVAENADIFEYVKRDIMFQLASSGLLNDIDLDKLITSIASYESFKEILCFLFSCMPAGDFINKLLEKGRTIKKKYDEQKATLTKYDSSFKAMRGGLYEDDAYTRMIRDALDYLRNSVNVANKKSVLVIEDLDRLDPGHLFRILNVVSAHIDNPQYNNDKGDNKFGFDNIVLVMDYTVTKQIFEHFYGPNASYDGYMSKFLTCQPFYYSIEQIAKNALYSYMSETIELKDIVGLMPNIKRYIDNMSVRDIERILSFDYRSRRKLKKIQIMAYWFSCDLPIFRLLCLMIECGLDRNEIQKDLELKPGQNVANYMELIYPLHLLSSDVYFGGYRSNNDNFQIKLVTEKDLIKKVEVHMVGSGLMNARDIKFIHINWRMLFEMLENCYNVSSLKVLI